jgi:uncharacterized protein (TIGR03435 family)
MADLAEVLGKQGFADRIVIDKTGVKGIFDIFLKWTPESLRKADPETRAGRDGTYVDPNGPDLPEALQQQLGLRLDSQKGMVDFFIVERAEKPSDN